LTKQVAESDNKNFFDFGATDLDGKNGLMLLCANFNRKRCLYQSIQLLLDCKPFNGKKISINYHDIGGYNALILFLNHCTPRDELFNIMRLLVSHGIDINGDVKDANNNLSESNVLLVLLRIYRKDECKDNLIDMVQFLIDNRIDLNPLASHNALDVLFHYQYNNQELLDISRLLIDSGTTVIGGENKYSSITALHALCRCSINKNNDTIRIQPDQLLSLFELLLRNGADVNARQSDGSTPLDILCRRSNQFSASKENESLFLDIIRLLIQYGLDVNAKGRYKHPLEELFWRTRIDGTLMFEAVTILIEHGLDLTVK